MTQFYQAQLVEIIAKLETKKSESKEWLFRWLPTEIEKDVPHRAAERRALPLRPCRARKTATSIREAFGSIPREVRDSLPPCAMARSAPWTIAATSRCQSCAAWTARASRSALSCG